MLLLLLLLLLLLVPSSRRCDRCCVERPALALQSRWNHHSPKSAFMNDEISALPPVLGTCRKATHRLPPVTEPAPFTAAALAFPAPPAL